MYLPGFSHHLGERQVRAGGGQVLRDTKRLDGLAALVARCDQRMVRNHATRPLRLQRGRCFASGGVAARACL